jgi:glutathione synthase/RimK-type ligase-like ATP-grasp enzyme
MRRLFILTDERSEFLISKADFKNFTSMNIEKIKEYFSSQDYNVTVCKFSNFDLNDNYEGVYFLYQTSEAPGSFYKRYIEDLIYFLEKHGAIVIPTHELLKAHHDKIFMEMMRSKFADNSLKTIRSEFFGSWLDARCYDSGFPVVIKQSSNSGGVGVYLAQNRNEFNKYIKKAGGILISPTLKDFYVDYFKDTVKNIIKYFYPERAEYVKYNTTPVSTSILVQTFINGLNGDYKVLIFGGKYYTMYRKNRENDFRASGSGMFYEVPEEEHERLLDFAHKITLEINFPIFGLDIGFDGKEYHLFEFQMIHLGTSAIHRSKFWHEFQDGKWVRFEGESDLEVEFSRSIISYINSKSISADIK